MSRTCPTCGKKWGTLTGPQMRALREASRLTLRAMSQRSGLSFAYLSKVERERPGFPPSAATEAAYRALIAAQVAS